jgi:hypothetical protein
MACGRIPFLYQILCDFWRGDRLWQYPKDSYMYMSTDECWFQKKPIGRYSLSQFMPKLNQQIGLSTIYTNHYVRATGATILKYSWHVAGYLFSIRFSVIFGEFIHLFYYIQLYLRPVSAYCLTTKVSFVMESMFSFGNCTKPLL